MSARELLASTQPLPTAVVMELKRLAVAAAVGQARAARAEPPLQAHTTELPELHQVTEGLRPMIVRQPPCGDRKRLAA